MRWPVLNQLQTLLLENNILNPRFKSVLIFSRFKSVLILNQSIQIRTNWKFARLTGKICLGRRAPWKKRVFSRRPWLLWKRLTNFSVLTCLTWNHFFRSGQVNFIWKSHLSGGPCEIPNAEFQIRLSIEIRSLSLREKDLFGFTFLSLKSPERV